MTDDTPFESLKSLYKSMDNTWNKIAAQYLFRCRGCEDNCCKSLFFHHTYVEKAYLRHGLERLDQAVPNEILTRAEYYCEKTFSLSTEPESLKIDCPVNQNGLCLLYEFRPMICRLHGLPHELSRPGGEPVMGKGCDAGQFENKPYVKFDRTVFYQQMARIEIAFRQTRNKTGRIKQTIAQLLISE